MSLRWGGWGLIPNICPGPGDHPSHLNSAGQRGLIRWAGIKNAFIINSLSAGGGGGSCDLWCQKWGQLRCQIGFPEASVLRSWRPVTALAAAVFITVLPSSPPPQSRLEYGAPPEAPLSPPRTIHPSTHLLLIEAPACLGRLERINRWHKCGLALALNATLR